MLPVGHAPRTQALAAARGLNVPRGTSCLAAPGARFASVQNELNLLDRADVDDGLAEAERQGLAYLPFYPLASGRAVVGKNARIGPFAHVKKIFGGFHVSAGARYDVRAFSTDAMFTRPDPDVGNFAAEVNSNSLEVLSDALVEPALAAGNSADAVQFERQGYFCRDADSQPGRPVFNRTVGLRDTWAKIESALAR